MDTRINQLQNLRLEFIHQKKQIAIGKTTKKDIFELISAFSPSNSDFKLNVKHSNFLDTEKSQFANMHSFMACVDLPLSAAKIFREVNHFTGGRLPFKSDIKISSEVYNDKVRVSITSSENFLDEIMRNPRHTATHNTERYAKYAIFRSVIDKISKAGLYQFINDKKYNPIFKHPASSTNVKSDDSAGAERLYISTDPKIDSLLSKHLTKTDLDFIKNSFTYSISFLGIIEQKMDSIKKELTTNLKKVNYLQPHKETQEELYQTRKIKRSC